MSESREIAPLRLLVVGSGILNQALRACGHSVLHVGSNADSDLSFGHPMTLKRLLELTAERGFFPEALLLLDNGNLPQVVGVEETTIPSIFYSIDTYCNPWHIPYAHAFDAVAVAQKGQLDLFLNDGNNAHWMPLFAQFFPEIDPDFEQRDVPVAFVGTLAPKNIPERKPFLQRFRSSLPLVIRQGDYVPLFTRTRIALNQTAFSELNYRCFEAPACGAALLMETAPNLEAVFTPGINCLPPYTRNNHLEAAAIAREWLAMPERLAEVAAAGRELVQTGHSAVMRAKNLTTHFHDLLKNGAVAQRHADLPRRRKLLSTAYAILALELQGQAYAAHREFYGRLHAALSE